MELWLPEYADEILCVTCDVQADGFDFEGMLKINDSAYEWLYNGLDTGTYFEILDHYGVDPFEFVKPIEELYLKGF